MSLLADLSSAVDNVNKAGRRAVVILRDDRLPAHAPIWHERLGGEHPLLVHTVAAASAVLAVADELLEHLDRLELAPFVVGFGAGARAALHINAEGAALRAATIGGRPATDRGGDEQDLSAAGPLLRITGEADADLPLSALQDWKDAQDDPSRIEVRALRGSLRSLTAGDGADAASAVVAEFFAKRIG